MNKNNKSEAQDKYKSRPVQNFPDYLKYVAKKSKAGFGKVHEELYRLYSGSFGSSDKSSPQSPDYKVEAPTETGTSKSKVGLRKRWSNTGRQALSSTGHDKIRATTCGEKFLNNSFVSYIPDENKSSESSTDSDHDYEIPSDEFEIKQGDCEKFVNYKTKLDSNTCDLRFSMPHSKLTEEAIYINDRVLHVEKIANLSKIDEKEEDTEKDCSDDHSTRKSKLKQQRSHEIDDYVNLRNPEEHALADIIDTMKNKTRKEIKEPINKLLKRNTIGTPYKISVTKQPSFNKMELILDESKEEEAEEKEKEEKDDDDDDDDDDYLPPTNWTHSCYTASSNIKYKTTIPEVKNSVSTLVKSYSTAVTKTDDAITGDSKSAIVDNAVDETDDNYYVPPSYFKDSDYENVPKGIKNSKIAVCSDSDISSGGQKIVDNLDKSRNKSINERPMAKSMPKPITDNDDCFVSRKMVHEENGSTYIEFVKDQEQGLSYGDYSVPKSTKVISKVENTDGINMECTKGQKRDSSNGDYSVPTFKKLVAKDYEDFSTGSHYKVPRGIRPVNHEHNGATMVKQSNYSVPRSHSIVNGGASLNNQQHAGASLNCNNENCTNEFYDYTVNEVVECLSACALTKLANICKEEQLDGEYFRTMSTDELQREPFLMNWYYISKLFKIIGGWRPKMK